MSGGRARPLRPLASLPTLLIALAAISASDSAAAAGRALPDPGCGPRTGLNAPAEKEIAQQLVSSAENSSLEWRHQYGYIAYDVEHDRRENRGYTGGLIGFTSRTGDMLALLRLYRRLDPPRGGLVRFIGPLRRVEGSPSRKGLGRPFVRAWERAARRPKLRRAQRFERDRTYFCPAVRAGRADGLGALGQFIYYDALVMHGPGHDPHSFGGIRAAAKSASAPPAAGGDETAYLNAFLDVRRRVMKSEAGHRNTSRIDTEQRRFLREGNLDLVPPLRWKTYGDSWEIDP